MRTPSGREKPDYPGKDEVTEMIAEIGGLGYGWVRFSEVERLMTEKPKASPVEVAALLDVHKTLSACVNCVYGEETDGRNLNCGKWNNLVKPLHWCNIYLRAEATE